MEKEIIRGVFDKKKLLNIFYILIFYAIFLIVGSIAMFCIESFILGLICFCISLSIIAGCIWYWIFINSLELIVTNKKVYYITKLKKFIIPLDSISAYEYLKNQAITITSSSGIVRMPRLINGTAVYNEINNLLSSRLTNTVEKISTSSTADEIKKYKDLLDCGAITQEEYESKKKELLNL